MLSLCPYNVYKMINGMVLCGKHSSRDRAVVGEYLVDFFIKWCRLWWGNGHCLF